MSLGQKFSSSKWYQFVFPHRLVVIFRTLITKIPSSTVPLFHFYSNPLHIISGQPVRHDSKRLIIITTGYKIKHLKMFPLISNNLVSRAIKLPFNIISWQTAAVTLSYTFS